MSSKPTQAQFKAYQGMYDFFNRQLFGGRLGAVILNFSRHAGALGFFAPERWEHSEGSTVAHEISLNPSYLKTRPPRQVAATLVHEMVHAWQQEHGTPSRRGYHNEEWARKMEEVGLQPSSTGEPGGKRVGQSMTHYILERGAFAEAFRRMPADCLLPWQSWEPEKGTKKPAPVSKLKYTCPGCELNVWGKPGLNLRCDDCDELLEAAA